MEPPRQGWIITEDGKVCATSLPEEIEHAQNMARTSPAKCGELYDAVCENEFEKVKEILCWEDKSVEKVEFRKWYVNEKSWNDWRPLHAAAEAGLTEMAELMVQCGADVNSLSNVKFTALHLAASGGYDKILKLLLENGADPRIQAEAGIKGTALHYAAGKGKYECVRLLTEVPGYEDLINEFNDEYCTALYYAVGAQCIDAIKILLEKGGRKTINETDWDGKTPLHIAAMSGNLELVKILVESGEADVKILDQHGRTASRIAKEMCQIEVMNYLDGK